MSSDREVVILSFARTPMTRLNGSLSSLSAAVPRRRRHPGRARPERASDASDVDQVLMGQVVQAGAGQNPARQAAVLAGIPWTVPATTINKVCLSGLTAIIDAARMIRLGEASVVVAGGQESMSQAPHLLPGSRRGWTYGDIQAVDSLAFDGLTDAFDRESMGSSTERGNKVTVDLARGPGPGRRREPPARCRCRSVRGVRRGDRAGRGAAAAGCAAGRRTPTRASGPIRRSESLASLRPAFSADGTITAGNASPLTDGAAAVVVAAREFAEARGLTVARVGRRLWAGRRARTTRCTPNRPRPSQRRSRAAAGTSRRVDLIEINEAFGSVVAQSLADLDYPLEQTNVHGGAIALGHPIGASGARLAGHDRDGAVPPRARARGGRAVRRRRAGRGAAALAGCRLKSALWLLWPVCNMRSSTHVSGGGGGQ